MKNQELIQNFERLVQEERRVTREVLEHIAEIESRRAYLDIGFDGMYAYLTQGLGYSEAAAYRRLQAARVLKVQPVVANRIEDGRLNLTQLAQVAKLSRQSKKAISTDLLEKLESKSKSATEQILAETFDLPIQEITNTKVQKDHSVRLEVTFTQEQFEDLKKAKALLSHICPGGEWAEVFSELAKQYSRKFEEKSKREDPFKTPPAAKLGVKDSTPKNAANGISASKRKYISVKLKRMIFTRSQGCCEYIDSKTGRKCLSRYQPQIDHIHPVSLGGDDHPENLQLLCGQHNRGKSNQIS